MGNANIHRGEVAVELDKPRIFKYPFTSILEIEELLKEDLGKDFKFTDLASDPTMFSSFKIMRLVVWGGLIWQDENLTLKDAGKIINTASENGVELSDIITKCMDVFTAHVTSKDDEELDETESGNVTVP